MSKQKVFDLLQTMQADRREKGMFPHYVTFRQLNERDNIPNMRAYLNELYFEKLIMYGRTVNDVWVSII